MGRNPSPKATITQDQLLSAAYHVKGNSSYLDNYIRSLLYYDMLYNVSDIVSWCNNHLTKHNDESVCTFVENVLHKTYTYAGFGYNDFGDYLTMMSREGLEYSEDYSIDGAIRNGYCAEYRRMYYTNRIPS